MLLVLPGCSRAVNVWVACLLKESNILGTVWDLIYLTGVIVHRPKPAIGKKLPKVNVLSIVEGHRHQRLEGRNPNPANLFGWFGLASFSFML